MRTLLLIIVFATVWFQPQTVPPVSAQVTSSDLSMLGLIFRNRFVPFSEQEMQPEFLAVRERVSALGDAGDDVELYKTMIEGMARMYLGAWDEGIEVASILDINLAGKLYEPGATVPVEIASLYEHEVPLEGRYAVQVRFLDPSEEPIYESDLLMLEGLAAVSTEVVIPREADSGRYLVEYSLWEEDASDPIVRTSRSIYVIEAFEERITAMLFDSRRPQLRRQVGRSSSRALANTTVLWHLDMYQRGRREWLAGAYMGYPVIMNQIFEQGTLMVEPMQFDSEIELAEEFINYLGSGRDPLSTRSGDMRLAYRSSVDRELVPFRLFVPDNYDRSQSYPLVVALHGAGGDENTFMESFDGTFKENARDRGYIVASVNGRGPYGGYRDASAQDVIDGLDLVQRVYPIDETRTYLMGHSMGGGGTVRIGFENADRFAALAPIAGYGLAEDLAKAPEMPLFIAQGELDALVPVERARNFHEAAQALGMPSLHYAENEGTDHVAIVAEVMDQIFDWFDLHRR